MSSRIEQQIDQIEDYIDGCKFQPFSNTKIIVDRDEIEDLLEQLRAKTPEEIKHYQRIISNKEAILNDARKKAEELINEATEHTNALVNEHEIMQQAYAQANEVVQAASAQAQEILDRAVQEANAYRASAAQYMDDMLSSLEAVTDSTVQRQNMLQNEVMQQLGGYLNTIRQNRAELALQQEAAQDAEYYNDYASEAGMTGQLDTGAVAGQLTGSMGTGPMPVSETGELNTDMFRKN